MIEPEMSDIDSSEQHCAQVKTPKEERMVKDTDSTEAGEDGSGPRSPVVESQDVSYYDLFWWGVSLFCWVAFAESSPFSEALTPVVGRGVVYLVEAAIQILAIVGGVGYLVMGLVGGVVVFFCVFSTALHVVSLSLFGFVELGLLLFNLCWVLCGRF